MNLLVISKKVQGVFCSVGASIAYGIIPLLTLTALSGNLSIEEVILYRFALSTIFAFVYIFASKESFRVTRKQLFHISIYVFVGYFGTVWLLTLSYLYIPTGLATMIHFTYPLIVTLLGVAFLKEKITPSIALSILLIIVGLALITQWSGELSIKGVLFALGSSVFYAIYLIGNRLRTISSLPAMVVVFYGMFLSTFASMPLVINSNSNPLPCSYTVIASIVLVSFFCTVLTCILVTCSVRYIGAPKTALISVLEPVTSIICGIIILNEPILVRSTVGMIVIILGSIITIIYA